jgi:hypothetical protein
MKFLTVGTVLLLADGRTDMAKRTRLERIQFDDKKLKYFISLASHKPTIKKVPTYAVTNVKYNSLPLKECATESFYVQHIFV